MLRLFILVLSWGAASCSLFLGTGGEGQPCDSRTGCNAGLACNRDGICSTEVIEPTVVGGNLDVDGIFPQVVLVGSGCTGTLVSPRHVLTAAHCFCAYQSTADGGKIQTASTCDSSATVTFKAAALEGESTRRHGAVAVHPSYQLVKSASGSVIQSRGDLAMITLETCAPSAIPEASLVPGPVTIPPGGVAFGRLVGFGNNDCDVEVAQAVRWWGDAFITSADSEFLALSSTLAVGGETVEGAISWKGDSGGPLWTDQTGLGWQLAGVLSKGTCGLSDGDTAWYTNLFTYSEWIKSHLSDARVDASGCRDLQPPDVSGLRVALDRETQVLRAGAIVRDRGGSLLKQVFFGLAVTQDDHCHYLALSDFTSAELVRFESETSDEQPEVDLPFSFSESGLDCLLVQAQDQAGNRSELRNSKLVDCAGGCLNGGTCDIGTGTCRCPAEFIGERCETCLPQCEGRECGSDGCGGTCGAHDGACVDAPAAECVVFGLRIDPQIRRHVNPSCEEGLCVWEPVIEDCEYACGDGRCVPMCALTEHRFQGFPAASSSDVVLVGGRQTVTVPYYCPSAVRQREEDLCRGSLELIRTAATLECDPQRFETHLSIDGSVAFICGEERTFPESVAVMVTCAGERALCPQDSIFYNPLNGALRISDCLGIFTQACASAVVQFTVRHPNGDQYAASNVELVPCD